MRNFSAWVEWAKHRPTVIINLVGILVIVFGLAGWFIYQQNRSVDVLQNWTIELSSPKEVREIDGKMVAVYHPNESLVFASKSVKLIEAEGVTTRMIVCEATDTQAAREIQLDTLPATRPIGSSPKRENAVTVPDVAQFAGLPRWCKLVIDVTYKDVLGTGRTQQEHAETERFLVEEATMTTQELLDKIQGLEDQINQLKSQLPTGTNTDSSQQQSSPSVSSSTPRTSTTNNTTNNSTTNNTTNNNTTQTPPTDDRSALGRLPVVGRLLDAIGL